MGESLPIRIMINFWCWVLIISIHHGIAWFKGLSWSNMKLTIDVAFLQSMIQFNLKVQMLAHSQSAVLFSSALLLLDFLVSMRCSYKIATRMTKGSHLLFASLSGFRRWVRAMHLLVPSKWKFPWPWPQFRARSLSWITTAFKISESWQNMANSILSQRSVLTCDNLGCVRLPILHYTPQIHGPIVWLSKFRPHPALLPSAEVRNPRISASTSDHRTWWHRLSLLGPNCAETQIAQVGCLA